MMRAFLAACVVAVVIAVGAAAALDLLIQREASTAFASSEVRN
jgi:hypothetical protein